MNASKIEEIEQAQLRTGLPDFRVGDTVRVHYKIVEGDKDRIQVFQGVVLKRHRAGARSTFTVRKVSFNVGVERVFLTHSPRIDKIEEIEQAQLRTGLPDFRVDDTVRVHYKIVEGDKDRVQVFQGVVLKRHRAGARSTFTVRKISFNVGVERVFLTHSPRIDKVEIVSKGVVRRARLFYLRELQGKAARVRDQKDN